MHQWVLYLLLFLYLKFNFLICFIIPSEHSFGGVSRVTELGWGVWGGGGHINIFRKKVSDEPKKAVNEFFTQSHVLFDQITYSP